jgi:histidine triad (HIT) family protein
MSTLFSRIIAGEIPSYKIYEDVYTYAFLDIFPQRLGHTLIVPKVEIDHFADVPEPYYSAIFQTAKKLSSAIQQATWCNRICTMFIWYEIPHCHYHLVPTDSLDDIHWENKPQSDMEELQNMQEKILRFLP